MRFVLGCSEKCGSFYIKVKSEATIDAFCGMKQLQRFVMPICPRHGSIGCIYSYGVRLLRCSFNLDGQPQPRNSGMSNRYRLSRFLFHHVIAHREPYGKFFTAMFKSKFFKKLMLLMAMLPTVLLASAYDFMVDGICYNVVSEADKTVEVTYEKWTASSLEHSYTNIAPSIDIPREVSNSGNIYTVVRIGEKAFYSCPELISVKLPDSVTSIADEAFFRCYELTSIELSDGLVRIGKESFYHCYKLTSINIPKSLKTIYNGAFSNCKGLPHVDLSSVTTIGNFAFSSCSNLSSITLSANLTSIDLGAFNYCENLTRVYCKSVTPPFTEEDIFDYTPLDTLYVPTGCKAAYIEVEPWYDFKIIKEMDFPSGVKTTAITNMETRVTTDGNAIIINGEPAGLIEVYTIGGQCVYSGTDRSIYNLARGVYLVKAGNHTTKIIL